VVGPKRIVTFEAQLKFGDKIDRKEGLAMA